MDPVNVANVILQLRVVILVFTVIAAVHCAPAQETITIINSAMKTDQVGPKLTGNGLSRESLQNVQPVKYIIKPTQPSNEFLENEAQENVANEIALASLNSKGTKVNKTQETSEIIPSVAKVTVFAYNNFKGASKYVEITGNCVNFHGDWHKRISSVNTHGTCVEVCGHSNCAGMCMRVAPGTLGHNRLRLVNFDKRIMSIRACPV